MSTENHVSCFSYSATAFAAERARMVDRIVPSSLIPMATATAMLIIGANNSKDDCYFELPHLLVICGAISLSMVVGGVMAKYVLECIVADGYVTRGERRVLLGLEGLAVLFAIVEGGWSRFRPIAGSPDYIKI
jgi:hypothetical protein